MAKYLYPENIMQKLRMCFDLERNDDSMDEQFEGMDPTVVFEKMLEWEGIIGYGGRILDWVQDIWGVGLLSGGDILVADSSYNCAKCDEV